MSDQQPPQLYSEKDYFRKADNLLRISCHALQGVFRDNWKRVAGSDWTKDSTKDLIKGDRGRQEFYANCNPIQKRFLEKGNVGEWDLELLSGLLQLDYFKPVDDDEDDAWKQKVGALCTLRVECGVLALNTQKEMGASAYQYVEERVRVNLSKLGVDLKTMDKWICRTDATSSIRLLNEAMCIETLDKTCSKEEYQEVIKKYDKVLLVPTLLPTHFRSTVYEQRASCYLELGIREDDKGLQEEIYEQALSDILEALNYDENSGEAHAILSKIHGARNELEEAVEHFEKALAICHPEAYRQKELRDDCKKILLSQEYVPHSGTGSKEKPKLPWTCSYELFRDNFEAEISERAKDSVTAQRILAVYGCIKKLNQVWNGGPPFGEEETKNIIDLVYEIFYLGQHLLCADTAETESQLSALIVSQFKAHCNEESELDKKLRICYVMNAEHTGHRHIPLEVVKEGLGRYPEEVIYYELLTAFHMLNFELKEGLNVADEGLTHFPNQLGLLYYKAVHTYPTSHKDDWNEEIYQDKISAYQEFIRRAPEDHQNLPEAYYSIVQCYFCLLVARKWLRSEQGRAAADKMLEFYDMAKRAEGKQLPWCLPYNSPVKVFVTGLVKMIPLLSRAQNASEDQAEVRASCRRVHFVKNSSRDLKHFVEIRRGHRSQDNNLVKKIRNARVKLLSLPPPCPNTLRDLKEITLRQLNPSHNKDYNQVMLNLVLIEDPMMVDSFLVLVGMDKTGYVIRLFIYKDAIGGKMRETLQFGCKLVILNPLPYMALDGILVMEQWCILPMGSVENMCRYCGQKDAGMTCSKCRWAKYCSKECQTADWKELNHKVICKPFTEPKKMEN